MREASHTPWVNCLFTNDRKSLNYLRHTKESHRWWVKWKYADLSVVKHLNDVRARICDEEQRCYRTTGKSLQHSQQRNNSPPRVIQWSINYDGDICKLSTPEKASVSFTLSHVFISFYWNVAKTIWATIICHIKNSRVIDRLSQKGIRQINQALSPVQSILRTCH